MNVNQEKDEVEVTETKYFRVFSMIALTVFFAIFFITLAVLLPEYLGIFLGLGFLVLCPISALSFHGYINDLRKKFSISAEEIRLQKTHSLSKIRWEDFDILSVRVKGEFYIDFPTPSGISRDYTAFRLLFIDQKSNRVVQTFKFRFYNGAKAREVLRLLKQNAQWRNKELKLKTKHM